MGKSALSQALGEAGIEPGQGIAADRADAETVDLFDAETGDQFERLPRAVEASRKRGRPEGARNLTTQKTVELILASRRDPLLYWADIVTMSPAEVMSNFGLKPADAAKHQMRAAENLAAYCHSKKPTEINANGAAVVPIVIGNYRQKAEPDRSGTAIEADEGSYHVIEVPEENQGLIDLMLPQSHAASRTGDE